MPLIIVFFICFLTYSCSPTIEKSGISEIDKFSTSFEGLNKSEIIAIIGNPSSLDSLNNSFIYFSEINNKKNIFNNKILSRNIYVIKFDEKNIFSSLNHYLLDDKNKIQISKNTTESEIIKLGYIEKIFGGIGRQKTIATMPKANVGNQ
jgi:outer membrane protein assembly factor BamE (lipoprotein component of BamABCDE complex)